MSTETNRQNAGSQSPERLGSVKCPCVVDLSRLGCRATCVHNKVEIQDVVELEAVLQSGGLLKPNAPREGRRSRTLDGVVGSLESRHD